MHFDIDMLHLAVLFRRETARANDEEFKRKAAAFDGRDELRDDYEQARLDVCKLKAQRRELELRLMRHGIETPPDPEDDK